MKFDLRAPCKNCPFRTDETRIKFSCKERAEEIAEGAYRNGFPCHLSAVHLEERFEGDPRAGFNFGPNTQHCAGALIMFLKDGNYDTGWPGINNSERRVAKLWKHLDMEAPVFETEEAFIEANKGRDDA